MPGSPCRSLTRAMKNAIAQVHRRSKTAEMESTQQHLISRIGSMKGFACLRMLRIIFWLMNISRKSQKTSATRPGAFPSGSYAWRTPRFAMKSAACMVLRSEIDNSNKTEGNVRTGKAKVRRKVCTPHLTCPRRSTGCWLGAPRGVHVFVWLHHGPPDTPATRHTRGALVENDSQADPWHQPVFEERTEK